MSLILNMFKKNKNNCNHEGHDFVKYWKLNTRIRHCVNCGQLYCTSYSDEDIVKIIYCG